MPTICKFPRGGYDITVVNKRDILKTIDDNILDKEVLKEILTQLEIDEEAFLREGRWVGVPFLGNVRIPPMTKLIHSEEQKALIKDARANLSREKYLVFRKDLVADNYKLLREDKFKRQQLAMNIRKYKYLYRKIRIKRGFNVANFIITNLKDITPVEVNTTVYGTE